MASGQLGPAEVDRADLAGLEERDGVDPVAAIEPQVAREVVAGAGGHDSEHAAVVRGHAGQRVHRSVPATGGHASPVVERRRAIRMASSRSSDTRTSTSRSVPASASTSRGSSFRVRPDPGWVHDRGPTHGGRSYRSAVEPGGVDVGSNDAPWNLDRGRIPRHVAIVMDGNGRWAKQRGLKRTEGHAAGEEALFDTVEGALDIGLEWMTVYAFSTENWRRPIDEVRFLMNFNENLLVRRRDDLHERGVRVRFIGRRGGRVPGRLRRQIADAEELTHRNRRMTLTFAFNYGGRAELVDAARAIGHEVEAGRLDPDKINDRTLARHLYAPDMPDPDLLVRTSGEFRISNYLLWELAYAELVFTDVLWPDFRRDHLFEAIREFQRRERRFGAVDG